MTDADRLRFADLKRRRDAAKCPTLRIYLKYAIYRLSAEIRERTKRHE